MYEHVLYYTYINTLSVMSVIDDWQHTFRLGRVGHEWPTKILIY